MELYLPPILPDYNPLNGRFRKGHVPATKGKKWDEYMGKRAQKRAARGWKNLDLYRPHGHPNAGRKKKQVVAVSDDGSWRVFHYIGAAAEWVGGSRENVGRCCRQNESKAELRKPSGKGPSGKVNTDHRYKGIRWYFETDSVWTKKIKQ